MFLLASVCLPVRLYLREQHHAEVFNGWNVVRLRNSAVMSYHIISYINLYCCHLRANYRWSLAWRRYAFIEDILPTIIIIIIIIIIIKFSHFHHHENCSYTWYLLARYIFKTVAIPGGCQSEPRQVCMNMVGHETGMFVRRMFENVADQSLSRSVSSCRPYTANDHVNTYCTQRHIYWVTRIGLHRVIHRHRCNNRHGMS